MSYRVAVDGHRSPVYTLRLKEPLAVLTFRKHLRFPSYSSLPEQEASSATGELDGLKGTRAEVIIETSGDVASAELARGGASRRLERLDAHHFKADMELLESGEYTVRLREAGTGASL